MDVASRYKGPNQLTSKFAKEVAQAFQWIYENTPLNYPNTLIVDDGKEFTETQYHKELEGPSKSNREWVSRLQNVVSALNNEKTRLIGMRPVDAIKQTLVEQGFSLPVKEYEEKVLDVGTKVRYLYEPGELEGYQYKGEIRKWSTDPIWSVDVYKIKDRYVQKHQSTLYYLNAGPKPSFVFEKLQPIHDP